MTHYAVASPVTESRKPAHFSCACEGIVGGLLVSYVEGGSSKREEDYLLVIARPTYHIHYNVVG